VPLRIVKLAILLFGALLYFFDFVYQLGQLHVLLIDKDQRYCHKPPSVVRHTKINRLPYVDILAAPS
ncbi:uncharacterized protein METZ01_LOCUS399563, partial [marine metagenome]